MELNKQVTSLELSNRLKELGVKQESIFWWREGLTIEIATSHKIRNGKNILGAICSAFTVAELGEMLPWDIVIARNIGKDWHITWQADGHSENDVYIITEKNESDARAKMLIYLLENKLIEL